MIDGLLSPMVADLASGERGQTEAVTALAAALPAQLTAHLIGFPEEIWPDIRTWSERLMRYDSVEKDPEAFQGFMQAIMEFVGVLQTTAAARRECPAADLVTTWVQGEDRKSTRLNPSQ